MSEETVVSPEEVPAEDSDRADYEAWKAARNAPRGDTGDFEYIRLPDGTVDRVRKTDIKGSAATAVVDAPDAYLHLANGEHVRVAGADVPTYAGTNAQYGHYTKDGKSYQVIGVYPVESEVSE